MEGSTLGETNLTQIVTGEVCLELKDTVCKINATVPRIGSKWKVREVPTPEPSVKQVLIKIHASGLCWTDVHISEDRVPTPIVFPRTCQVACHLSPLYETWDNVAQTSPFQNVCIPNLFYEWIVIILYRKLYLSD